MLFQKKITVLINFNVKVKTKYRNRFGDFTAPCFVDKCISVIDKGRYYRGRVSSTRDGETCIDWDKHNYDVTPKQYPDEGLDKNYCRNPLGSGERPWCYTKLNHTGSDYWGYCRIPACGQYVHCQDMWSLYLGSFTNISLVPQETAFLHINHLYQNFKNIVIFWGGFRSIHVPW